MTKELPGRPEVRAKVLKAALLAAADAAPGPVKVADIARRAEMSPGHVMYYFQRRDRIVAETLLHAERELAEKRDKQLAKAADAEQALETLVRLYLPSNRADARWRLWAQLLASAPDDAETRGAFAGVIDSWAEALAAVIATGRDQGTMACQDPATAAYQACRLMDGYALEVLMGAPGRGRTWAVRSVLDAVRRSVS
ncbi:MAG: TetR/AcrR family transcriptional regulator [Nocardioidaceae bacterium]|nr:TetR/AcrR family transcriptional regulator [Nocardioidaceae bacterium]